MSKEIARSLLKSLVNNGCRAENDIPNAQIKEWAAQSGINGADLNAALEYADQQKWIEAGSRMSTTKVTLPGWEIGNS